MANAALDAASNSPGGTSLRLGGPAKADGIAVPVLNECGAVVVGAGASNEASEGLLPIARWPRGKPRTMGCDDGVPPSAHAEPGASVS